MKRIPLIFFLVIAFFASRQATAQQVNEGFESNTFPPPGWDTINVSGTARWVSSIQSGKIHSGSKAAYGQFETQPAPTTADNWLITPKIYSITATDNLNFWSIADYSDIDNGFFDTLYVLVSTTGKSTSNFTTQILKFATYTQTTYTQHTVSLSAFAGQNIYIAFRHFNQNGNGIFIDDVTAGTPLANDVASSSLTVSQTGIVKTGSSVNITNTLKNVGTNTIAAGLPVKYNVNNGPAVMMTTTASMTAGNTTTVTFSGANAFTPASPGTYVVKVYADAVSEINRGNDTLVYTFTVQTPVTSFPYFQPFNNPVGWSFDGTGNWDYSKSEIIAQATTDVINPAGNNDSAAVARFYNAASGTIYYLRSPLMNFTGISKPMLNFYVAHRTGTSQNDQLEVLVSLDGGTTYQSVPLLYNKSYLSTPSLSTVAPDAGTRYVPASAADWRHEIVDLSAYAGQPSVLIAFKGTSRTGNYLWIDNVNILSQQPSEYVAAKIIATNQVITETTNKVSVKFNSVPNVDSARIQGHSFSPPANNFVQNNTATSNDGSIETPNFVFPRWATIAFSGNAITRANYNISIDYFGLSIIGNGNNLYILKRADQSGDWVALPTTRVGTVLTSSGLDKFSDFAIGYKSGTVPLNLINFNVRLVNSVSVLQWKVAQVKNVTSFDVERKAGNTWENIGNVVVTSALQNDYNFKDAAARNGINYYRLKINDGNGSFIYSNIVSVSLKTSFLVFQNAPNPFKDYTIIRYEIDEKVPVKIQVFNLSGSRVAVLTDEIKDQGSYEIRFNTSQLTPGNYYLKFTAGDKTEVKKMIRL